MVIAPVPKKIDKRLNAAKRKLFFAHLSETANVSASARVAGISSSTVYAERRRSAEFKAAWSEALTEGYARLEADLLAEALQAVNGQITDGTLKARAQKHRLGISLLGVHRANAKHPADTMMRHPTNDLGVLKAQLILKLTQMRERASISLAGDETAAVDVAG